ncbi:MAG: ATP-dependent Clp protease adaptor ClpS, partial [Candidatus Obscuribacterales bacterium]|nr:ATP-dependent Clp protease adaptor ClpS [Candidatus Obscuribacterales bacterium]
DRDKSKGGHESKSAQDLVKVFLHNDDKTTIDFVVFVLMSIFDKSETGAQEVMLRCIMKGWLWLARIPLLLPVPRLLP